jgi:hypothetical protein
MNQAWQCGELDLAHARGTARRPLRAVPTSATGDQQKDGSCHRDCVCVVSSALLCKAVRRDEARTV